jgi:hypothetical protein
MENRQDNGGLSRREATIYAGRPIQASAVAEPQDNGYRRPSTDAAASRSDIHHMRLSGKLICIMKVRDRKDLILHYRPIFLRDGFELEHICWNDDPKPRLAIENGSGERAEIGQLRKADWQAAKPVEAPIPREVTLPEGSGSWRRSRRSLAVIPQRA